MKALLLLVLLLLAGCGGGDPEPAACETWPADGFGPPHPCEVRS